MAAYDLPGSVIRQDVELHGSATSDAADMGTSALYGVIVPASMAGTSLKFEMSPDGSTYYPVRDEFGSDISVTIGATAGFYRVGRVPLFGLGKVKVVSSASETSKTVTLVGQRPV